MKCLAHNGTSLSDHGHRNFHPPAALGPREAAATALRAALLRGLSRPRHTRLMATLPPSSSAPGSSAASAGAAQSASRWKLTREAASSVAGTASLLLPTLSGAVDVCLVRQRDGTLKASPFYGAAAGEP